MDNIQTWKEFEHLLANGLKKFGVIDSKFTGQLTFHFSLGGISDMDRFEKSLKRKQDLMNFDK